MKKRIILFSVLFFTFISSITFAQNKSFITDKTAFAASINVPKILDIMSNYKPLEMNHQCVASVKKKKTKQKNTLDSGMWN